MKLTLLEVRHLRWFSRMRVLEHDIGRGLVGRNTNLPSAESFKETTPRWENLAATPRLCEFVTTRVSTALHPDWFIPMRARANTSHKQTFRGFVCISVFFYKSVSLWRRLVKEETSDGWRRSPEASPTLLIVVLHQTRSRRYRV